jgi:O-antigen/teichoic acid export membrane protein
MSIVKSLLRKIGMDGAIAYSSGSRIVAGVTGVVSVFFITSFLTGVEQGFYYTFGSILALQVFFELGLTGIMTQYVAHEASHLTLEDNHLFVGDEKYKSRLASLIHFCVKWYAVLSAVVLVFLLIVGYVYFNHYGSEHENVSWKTPWFLLCVGTAIKLFQSPFNSILMGLGKVKEMSKIGFWQQVIIPATIWVGLATGFKLYVVGFSYLASVVIWQVFVHRTGLEKIIIALWKDTVTERVSYLKEIFPFQWKIALSWVSGYFIFQLFNPVLFATEGAIVAGQMGMTLTAINAIQAFSMSWINTKIPLYSQLIAQKDYLQLDHIFNKTLKQMTSVCLGLLVLFFILIWFLNVTQLRIGNNVLSERFLSYLPMILIALPMYFQQYIYSWATYLRCHKEEPFLWNSVVCGAASCLSTLVLGKFYGLYGITIGYFVIQSLALPWGYMIFKTKKREWHGA